MEVSYMRRVIAFIALILPIFANSSGLYVCEIKSISSLNDKGYLETKYDQPYIGKTFTVAKSSGVMSGIIQNTLGGTPKVIQHPSKDWAYKVITESTTKHKDVYYLLVQDFKHSRSKPFMFIQSGFTFHGLCQ
jgi:D-serine dehydratase